MIHKMTTEAQLTTDPMLLWWTRSRLNKLQSQTFILNSHLNVHKRKSTKTVNFSSCPFPTECFLALSCARIYGPWRCDHHHQCQLYTTQKKLFSIPTYHIVTSKNYEANSSNWTAHTKLFTIFWCFSFRHNAENTPKTFYTHIAIVSCATHSIVVSTPLTLHWHTQKKQDKFTRWFLPLQNGLKRSSNFPFCILAHLTHFITFAHCHCRSQLSICSEPTVTTYKQLSCQSSIEPCVPEEDQIDIQASHSTCANNDVVIDLKDNQQVIVDKCNRPDSLILKTTTIAKAPTKASTGATKKFLQRSQSTNVYKSKAKVKSTRVMSNDLDQIYVISSSNNCMQSDLDDYYDSIDVIHERRSKNFSRFSDSETDKDKESATAVTNTMTTCRVGNENIVETIVDIEPRRSDDETAWEAKKVIIFHVVRVSSGCVNENVRKWSDEAEKIGSWKKYEKVLIEKMGKVNIGNFPLSHKKSTATNFVHW